MCKAKNSWEFVVWLVERQPGVGLDCSRLYSCAVVLMFSYIRGCVCGLTFVNLPAAPPSHCESFHVLDLALAWAELLSCLVEAS